MRTLSLVYRYQSGLVEWGADELHQANEVTQCVEPWLFCYAGSVARTTSMTRQQRFLTSHELARRRLVLIDWARYLSLYNEFKHRSTQHHRTA